MNYVAFIQDGSGDQIAAIGTDINEIANQNIYQDTELLNGTDNSGSITLTFQTGERGEEQYQLP